MSIPGPVACLGPLGRRMDGPRVRSGGLRQVEMSLCQEDGMKQTVPGYAGRWSPVRIAELASGREDKPPIRWFIGGTVGEGLYPAVEDSHATCFVGLIPEPHAPPNRPPASQLRGRTLLSRGGRCALRSVFCIP